MGVPEKAARIPLNLGGDGTYAVQGPNVLKAESLPVRLGVWKELGMWLGWHSACLAGTKRRARLLRVAQPSGSGGQEAQKFKVIFVQLEASLGYSRPCFQKQKKKEKKRKQFKGTFLLTFSSSCVLFLSKPVLERGAPDTGVTHHAELLSTKSVQTQRSRQSPRRGKRNSVEFLSLLKNFFFIR